MLTEAIYQDNQISISINLIVLRHENIGKGVFRAFCKVNETDCKRVHQPHLYPNPIWDVEGRIVANWFAELLENAYQSLIKGQIIIVHQNQ